MAKKTILNWRRFKNDDTGTAAIEFSFLAIPFLMICFAILETGVGYLADRTLEMSVGSIARQIRIGAISSATYAGAANPTEEFKEQLCRESSMFLFDCDKVIVDVKTLDNFEPPNAPEYDLNGNMIIDNFGFEPGGGGTINIVTVYYDWPTVVSWNAFGADIGHKKRMMVSVEAFVNESFN